MIMFTGGSRNARWVSEEDAPQREFGGTGGGEEEDDEAAAKIEEPDFGLSGKLTAETNTFRVREKTVKLLQCCDWLCPMDTGSGHQLQ